MKMTYNKAWWIYFIVSVSLITLLLDLIFSKPHGYNYWITLFIVGFINGWNINKGIKFIFGIESKHHLPFREDNP